MRTEVEKDRCLTTSADRGLDRRQVPPKVVFSLRCPHSNHFRRLLYRKQTDSCPFWVKYWTTIYKSLNLGETNLSARSHRINYGLSVSRIVRCENSFSYNQRYTFLLLQWNAVKSHVVTLIY